VIPQQYRPAVEKGVVETMKKASLQDILSLICGSRSSMVPTYGRFLRNGIQDSRLDGLKKAFIEAKPVLQEPIMKVEVTTPDDTLGAVIGDLNSKRGKSRELSRSRGKPEDTVIGAHVRDAHVC